MQGRVSVAAGNPDFGDFLPIVDCHTGKAMDLGTYRRLRLVPGSGSATPITDNVRAQIFDSDGNFIDEIDFAGTEIYSEETFANFTSPIQIRAVTDAAAGTRYTFLIDAIQGGS